MQYHIYYYLVKKQKDIINVEKNVWIGEYFNEESVFIKLIHV